MFAEHVSKAEQVLLHGCVGGGGGGGGTCLVAKQAVEYPQVLASLYNYTCPSRMMMTMCNAHTLIDLRKLTCHSELMNMIKSYMALHPPCRTKAVG